MFFPLNMGDLTLFLMVRVLYLSGQGTKVLYWTNKGSCDPIVEAEGIQDHFQVMLKDAHWGYWKQGPPNQGNHSNIKVGDFEVLEVNDT
jgi:hypothetical protein